LVNWQTFATIYNMASHYDYSKVVPESRLMRYSLNSPKNLPV